MKARELWEGILKEHQDFIGRLYTRWLDEKEYEDIQEYLLPFGSDYPQPFKSRSARSRCCSMPTTTTWKCASQSKGTTSA